MKRFDNPYWYKLIKVFKEADPPYKITTGLTIPFIIGSYELLGEPFESVANLVFSIRGSEIDKFPVIQKCPDIRKHVVMVEEKEICNKTYEKDIPFKNPLGKNILFISRNALLLGSTIEKVIWNLSEEYSDPIDNKKYSWSKSKERWRDFDENEKELIKSVKKNYS